MMPGEDPRLRYGVRHFVTLEMHCARGEHSMGWRSYSPVAGISGPTYCPWCGVLLNPPRFRLLPQIRA